MPVPKRKTSPSRKGMRQQRHAKATSGSYTENPDTGTQVLRHHATREADGSMWFNGVQVRKPKVRASQVEDSAE